MATTSAKGGPDRGDTGADATQAVGSRAVEAAAASAPTPAAAAAPTPPPGASAAGKKRCRRRREQHYVYEFTLANPPQPPPEVVYGPPPPPRTPPFDHHQHAHRLAALMMLLPARRPPSSSSAAAANHLLHHQNQHRYVPRRHASGNPCTNCGIMETSTWRRLNPTRELACNSCSDFYRRRQAYRPIAGLPPRTLHVDLVEEGDTWARVVARRRGRGKEQERNEEEARGEE